MSKIQILDCTLRDGGYVNNWEFGDECARDIVQNVASAGVDYIELGFIRNCNYIPGVIQFNDMSQVERIFSPCDKKLAIMVEIGYGYPFSKFPLRSKKTVDLVRIIVWKHMVREAIEYAKRLKDLGYEVGLQATRTDQYTEIEFAKLVDEFNSVSPDFVYIVDTFGLLSTKQVVRYARISDDHLDVNTGIGFHSHNNMQQAFSNSVAFVECGLNHSVIIDASLMGIGRGAGNLSLEIFLKYLSENVCKNYDRKKLYRVINNRILPIYKKNPWGYSVPYLLSAENGCNPTYVPYLLEKGLGIVDIEQVFAYMKEQGFGVRFDTELCDKIIREISNGRG